MLMVVFPREKAADFLQTSGRALNRDDVPDQVDARNEPKTVVFYSRDDFPVSCSQKARKYADSTSPGKSESLRLMSLSTRGHLLCGGGYYGVGAGPGIGRSGAAWCRLVGGPLSESGNCFLALAVRRPRFPPSSSDLPKQLSERAPVWKGEKL